MCRTYGWTVRYALHEVDAVQVMMLWRCYAQGEGGLETETLEEREKMRALGWGLTTPKTDSK